MTHTRILLTSGGTGFPIHATGPGPQELVDYRETSFGTKGLYGVLPSSSFFTAAEVGQAVGLAPTISTANPDWYKFLIDDKILFVCRSCISLQTSWQAIYLAGAVYGRNDFGVINANGVNRLQNSTITKDGFTYKVRLLKGASLDPTGSSGFGNNLSFSFDSEWNRLISAFADASGDGARWVGASNIMPFDMEGSAWTLCQEASSNVGDLRVVRKTSSTFGAYLAHVGITDANRGWRPVLELIQ